MPSDVSEPLRRSGTVNIPTELSDTIIDYLHDDKKSLTACSLVARHWLPASRYHLIPKIIVGVKNADNLLALLDSPHSTLTALATELAILAPPDEDIGLVCTSKLLSLTKKFTLLNSLVIVGLNFGILGDLHALDHFPALGVTKLFLAHCHFESNAQFSTFISLLNGLEQIFCLRSDDGRALPSSAVAFPPLLKKLSIMENPIESTRWWATQPLPPSLRNISIEEITGREEYKDINSLVAHAAPSLRNLDISISDNYRDIQDARSSLDLSGCPSLQTFTVTIRCLHNNKTLLFLPALVAAPSLSSGSLNQMKLVIDLEPRTIKDLDKIPWKDLDLIFTGVASPNKVVVELLNADYDDDLLVVEFDEEEKDAMKKIIHEGLQETAGCGKLQVRWPADPPFPQYMIDVFVVHDEMYPT